MNKRKQWVAEDIPELRIVEQTLWEQVQTRLGKIRQTYGAGSAEQARFYERWCAQHILTDKVFCAACGGGFGTVGRSYLACSTATRQGCATTDRATCERNWTP